MPCPCNVVASAVPTATCSSSLSAADLVLNPAVLIVIDESEPAPILRAAQDLKADLEKVLGQPSPITHSLATSPAIFISRDPALKSNFLAMGQPEWRGSTRNAN